MMRLFVYLFLIGLVIYWLKERNISSQRKVQSELPSNSRKWFRSRRHPREPWIQVYETESMEEARIIQARLEEEELECIVYEQGKKDIHGNPLRGVGIAVPKTSGPHAQKIISRLPV